MDSIKHRLSTLTIVMNIGWRIAHTHSKFELCYNSHNPTLHFTTSTTKTMYTLYSTTTFFATKTMYILNSMIVLWLNQCTKDVKQWH